MGNHTNSNTILIVDDELEILTVMDQILRPEGYHVLCVESGKKAIEIIKREEVDLILLDLKIPDIDGMQVLKECMQHNPDQLVIVITGYASVETVVNAIKSGAYDFLMKPLEPQRILLTVKNALEKTLLLRAKQTLLEETRNCYKMIGVSEKMKKIFRLIDRVASLNTRVLIHGESGTGKELVARAIHFNSNRASAAFYSLNCAAIPEELIESELFGHVKGAFTHAVSDKKGAFTLAHKGTLLLDEVADLSQRAQAKVLRVIENGEVNPVGGQEIKKVDVRVISATHRNLEELIQNGAFREDLYHRINVVIIHIPPLRERPEDIGPLAEHFVNETCIQNNVIQKKISEDAIALLSNQEWKGNARELRNVIERSVIITDSRTITSKEVFTVLQTPQLGEQPYASSNFHVAREIFEKIYLLEKLHANNWNITKTAKAIGLDRAHLHRKIKKYQITESRVH